jgi:GNAT superfamily N-acetyltransferase
MMQILEHIQVQLSESYRMKTSDKKVVDAFVRKGSGEGHALVSNGKKLERMWLGGGVIARWRGKYIVVVSDESSKVDETIIRYMKKKAGKRNVLHSYADSNNPASLEFEHGGDVYGDQYNGWIRAYVPERKEHIGELSWSYWRGKTNIRYVEVKPDYRRSGVATELYKELFRKEKITAKDLSPSMRTDDGAAFRKGARLY